MADYEKIKHYLITERGTDLSALKDAFSLCVETGDHDTNREIRRLANKLVKSRNSEALDLYYKTHLFDAPVSFDSYMLYMEKNRDTKKQFYFPRRKQLKQVADAMQELSERKIRLLAVSLPPGTGKTTLALFFLTWLAGKNYDKPILTGSHNNDFLRGVYGECLRLLDPQGEYLWGEVFPELHVIQQDAKTMMIDVGRDKRDSKRFMTLEFTSIGSQNAGKVRAENLLYCDDLVSGIEQAMNKAQLDKLWQGYTDDLRQRGIGDWVELHIATRWSVHDVIGRLERLNDGNDTAKFIVIPALDENDESNFDYPIEAGFPTWKYHEQREIMDDASWKALFMNEPIEREGLLYEENELRRYFELPDGEPDAIISVCDTKDRGTDYCFSPIAYQYGQDFYIEDMLCDNSNPEVVEARLVNIHIQHNVQMSRFESNSAGGKIAEKVQNEIKVRGGRTKITTKYTTQNKETKIIVNSPWVKEHCLFKDSSVIKQNKEYRKALNFLTGYTMAGKNKNDDVPDGMAQLAEFAQSLVGMVATVGRSPLAR